MEIPIPAVTRVSLQTKTGNTVEGVLVRYVHGQDLLMAGEAQLFQAKELIAADKLVRLCLGDGDGHAGNLLTTMDGMGFSIDHGLADVAGVWRKQEKIELGQDMRRKVEVLSARDETMQQAEGYLGRGDFDAAQEKFARVLTEDNLRKLWEPIYDGREKEMEAAIQETLARCKRAPSVLAGHFPAESVR